MNIKNSILYYIKCKKIKWHAHERRTDEERQHRKLLGRLQPGGRRRRKGRPPNSWMLETTTGVRARGINSME